MDISKLRAKFEPPWRHILACLCHGPKRRGMVQTPWALKTLFGMNYNCLSLLFYICDLEL